MEESCRATREDDWGRFLDPNVARKTPRASGDKRDWFQVVDRAPVSVTSSTIWNQCFLLRRGNKSGVTSHTDVVFIRGSAVCSWCPAVGLENYKRKLWTRRTFEFVLSTWNLLNDVTEIVLDHQKLELCHSWVYFEPAGRKCAWNIQKCQKSKCGDFVNEATSLALQVVHCWLAWCSSRNLMSKSLENEIRETPQVLLSNWSKEFCVQNVQKQFHAGRRTGTERYFVSLGLHEVSSQHKKNSFEKAWQKKQLSFRRFRLRISN